MLNDRDRATLDLAAAHYAHAGRREHDIAETFGESAARFWQRVNALLDQPEAEAAMPAVVRRLRRLREARRVARAG